MGKQMFSIGYASWKNTDCMRLNWGWCDDDWDSNCMEKQMFSIGFASWRNTDCMRDELGMN